MPVFNDTHSYDRLQYIFYGCFVGCYDSYTVVYLLRLVVIGAIVCCIQFLIVAAMRKKEVAWPRLI